jgi:hypothetical protein
MSQNETYTTSQVEILTDLAPMSIYRYTRLFPEFFSPGARQHVHGRRWQDQDIIILNSIKALFGRRAGTEAIRETLRSGWTLAAAPLDNPDLRATFETLFEVCMNYKTEAEKDRAAAHSLTLGLAAFRRREYQDHEKLFELERKINRIARKRAFISFGQ